MNRKIVAVIAALVLSFTVIPVASSDSEASTTTVSMSDRYLCMTTVDWDSQYRVDRSYYYFNVNSENDLKMQKYIEDQKTPVLKDDRSNLNGKVHIYVYDRYPTTSIAIFNNDWERVDILICNSVLEPFNNSFFVKAGDTFRIHMYSVKDMNGNATRATIINPNYEYYDISQGDYIEECNKSGEMKIAFDPEYRDGTLLPYCYSMTYEASGYSEPNGSATIFIAICAIVAVLALGLLILSGKKPGWSK